MFYRGVLAELRKSAEEPIEEPEKKHNVAPWLAGAAGLGLGGYGLYKALQNKGAPQTPPIPSAQNLQVPPTPALNNYDKATLGLSAGGLAAVPGINKIPGVNKIPGLKPFGNLSASMSMITDAMNPHNGMSTSSRVMEGGIGGVEGTANLIGNKLVAPIASKVLPEMLMTGAKSIAGGPLSTAMIAGQVGKAGIQEASAQAQQHSDMLGQETDALVDNSRLLKSPLNTPQHISGLQNLYNLFNTTPGQDYTKRVTDPSLFARLGYGQKPEMGAFDKSLAKTRELFNNDLDTSGLRKPLLQNDLSRMAATQGGGISNANSVANPY